MSHPNQETPPAPTIPRIAVSVREAAAALGISVRTVYTLIEQGTLRARKVRSRTVIATNDLYKLLA